MASSSPPILQKEKTTQSQSYWVDEKVVHAKTGISLSTLRKHRHLMKGIPYTKVGRSVRYYLADVMAFMEANKILPFQ